MHKFKMNRILFDASAIRKRDPWLTILRRQ